MASLEESLYDDLFEHLADGKTVVKTALLEVEEELHRLKADLELTRSNLAEAQNQNAKLQKEKEILVKNISCLFKTAQLEIARKDKQIKELNAENMRMKLSSCARNARQSNVLEKGPSVSPPIVAMGTPFKGSQGVQRQENMCERIEEEGLSVSPCLASKGTPIRDSQGLSRQENLPEHTRELIHQRHWNEEDYLLNASGRGDNEWKNRQPLSDLNVADDFFSDRLEAKIGDGNHKRQRADCYTDAFKERRRRLMLSSKPGMVTFPRDPNDCIDEEGGRGAEDRLLRHGKDHIGSVGNFVDRVTEEDQRQRRKSEEDRQTSRQGRDYAYVLDSTNSRGEEQRQIRKGEEDSHGHSTGRAVEEPRQEPRYVRKIEEGRHGHSSSRAGEEPRQEKYIRKIEEEPRHIRKIEEDRQLARHGRDYPSVENPSIRVELKHARKGDEDRRSKYATDNDRCRIERSSFHRETIR